MSRYIDTEDVINRIASTYSEHGELVPVWLHVGDIPSADVIEVGKAYPREELEQYGLTEWKDKHGKRWVMIERREHEDGESE